MREVWKTDFLEGQTNEPGKVLFHYRQRRGVRTSINLGDSLRPVTDGTLQIQIPEKKQIILLIDILKLILS